MFHDIEKKNRGPVQLGPLEGCPVPLRHFASSCQHCKRIWAVMVNRHRVTVDLVETLSVARGTSTEAADAQQR
jgi:hypothetical protein